MQHATDSIDHNRLHRPLVMTPMPLTTRLQTRRMCLNNHVNRLLRDVIIYDVTNLSYNYKYSSLFGEDITNAYMLHSVSFPTIVFSH